MGGGADRAWLVAVPGALAPPAVAGPPARRGPVGILRAGAGRGLRPRRSVGDARATGRTGGATIDPERLPRRRQRCGGAAYGRRRDRPRGGSGAAAAARRPAEPSARRPAPRDAPPPPGRDPPDGL